MEFKELYKFSTWMYTIAKNLAFTELRKKKRRKTTSFSEISKQKGKLWREMTDDKKQEYKKAAEEYNKNLKK